MTLTTHGHYIPSSPNKRKDLREERDNAQDCGGIHICDECTTEAEQWFEKNVGIKFQRATPGDFIMDGKVVQFPNRSDLLEQSAELEAAKMRHPSKYPEPKIRHEYVDAMGDVVTAWRVEDVLSYHKIQQRLPVIFKSVADDFEVSPMGNTLHKMGDDPRDFTVLCSTDWIVFFGGGRGARILDETGFKEMFRSYEEVAIQNNHEWLHPNGYVVIAWRVREVVLYHSLNGRWPAPFEQFGEYLEIDGTGKILREIKPNSDFFQILESDDFLVRHDGTMHVVKGSTFLETYSQEPIPAEPVKEMVNHPAHYGGKDNPYEVIKVIEAWELDFHLGSAVKYIPRAGKKDPELEIQDLEKAAFYINRKIELLRKLKEARNG